MTGRYAAHTGIGPDVLVENVSDTGRLRALLCLVLKVVAAAQVVRRAQVVRPHRWWRVVLPLLPR